MKTKTWTLCLDKNSAKIFVRDERNQTDQLCYTIDSSIQPKTSFLKYIAEEMELACGWGTNNNLVVRGEQNIVKKITKLFSYEVRSSIQQLPLLT